MKRYKYLDAARGIGMMLVVIGHSAGLNKYLSYFFVQLFFVLSGCVYRPGRSYGEQVAKKAKRLLIPYFSCNAVLLAFYALTGRSWEETKFSALGVLYSRACLYNASTTPDADNIFFFNIANGASWYLTAFFVTALVFHLVIDRCLEDKKFLAGCIAVLMALAMALAELPVLLPWSIDIASSAAIFMILGALLIKGGFFEKDWNIGWIAGVIVSYIVLAEVNPGLNTSVREYGIYGRWSVPFYIALGFCGSVLCIWAAKLVQDTFVGTFLVYIGNHTIILLSFHILVLELFGIVAGRLFDVGALTGAAYALYHIIRISVSICACLVLDKMIEITKEKLSGRQKRNER